MGAEVKKAGGKKYVADHADADGIYGSGDSYGTLFIPYRRWAENIRRPGL